MTRADRALALAHRSIIHVYILGDMDRALALTDLEPLSGSSFEAQIGAISQTCRESQMAERQPRAQITIGKGDKAHVYICACTLLWTLRVSKSQPLLLLNAWEYGGSTIYQPLMLFNKTSAKPGKHSLHLATLVPFRDPSTLSLAIASSRLASYPPYFMVVKHGFSMQPPSRCWKVSNVKLAIEFFICQSITPKK